MAKVGRKSVLIGIWKNIEGGTELCHLFELFKRLEVLYSSVDLVRPGTD